MDALMILTGHQRRPDDNHNIILAQQPGASLLLETLTGPVANDISMIEGESGRT
jgi:hypothetical protein